MQDEHAPIFMTAETHPDEWQRAWFELQKHYGLPHEHNADADPCRACDQDPDTGEAWMYDGTYWRNNIAGYVHSFRHRNGRYPASLRDDNCAICDFRARQYFTLPASFAPFNCARCQELQRNVPPGCSGPTRCACQCHKPKPQATSTAYPPTRRATIDYSIPAEGDEA